MITEDYLTAIKVKLLTSPVVQSFTIIKERVILDRGYFRDRLTLKNGDFCEIVEFFAVQNQTCVRESYRYQWMDGTRAIAVSSFLDHQFGIKSGHATLFVLTVL